MINEKNINKDITLFDDLNGNYELQIYANKFLKSFKISKEEMESIKEKWNIPILEGIPF